jgi:hypothetical protein
VRIVSLLIAFCFSLNVMASTGTVQELEKALDDYHYSLSVEWDQKDQKFYDAKTSEFFSQLEKMIKEDGLSRDQMMTVVDKKVNSKAVIESLKLKMNLLSKNSSSEDLAKLIKESSQDMYARGASWNGDLVFPVVIGLVLAAVVGYAAYWDAHHVCVQTSSQYICNTFNNCGFGNGYYDSSSGGIYYGGCNGTAYTTCGYQDVCTEYAEK